MLQAMNQRITQSPQKYDSNDDLVPTIHIWVIASNGDALYRYCLVLFTFLLSLLNMKLISKSSTRIYVLFCKKGMEFPQDVQKVMNGFTLKVTLSFKAFLLEESQEVEAV